MFKLVLRLCGHERGRKFQSLGRDSGCSSTMTLIEIALDIRVSIPRSGFWVFKPVDDDEEVVLSAVSIPRSGFWVFKLPVERLWRCFA